MTAGYKKYMKKNSEKNFSAIKLFLCTFFGMLLVFIFVFKYFLPSADVSIGEEVQNNTMEDAANVDGRLTAIQEEDTNKNYFDIKKDEDYTKPQDDTSADMNYSNVHNSQNITNVEMNNSNPSTKIQTDIIYKVYIGSYTSLEQAKVAKDIITETNLNISPIIKCLGSNNYTLQVGIFKNKMSAEDLLESLLKNHLPGRIIEES